MIEIKNKTIEIYFNPEGRNKLLSPDYLTLTLGSYSSVNIEDGLLVIERNYRDLEIYPTSTIQAIYTLTE